MTHYDMLNSRIENLLLWLRDNGFTEDLAHTTEYAAKIIARQRDRIEELETQMSKRVIFEKGEDYCGDEECGYNYQLGLANKRIEELETQISDLCEAVGAPNPALLTSAIIFLKHRLLVLEKEIQER